MAGSVFEGLLAELTALTPVRPVGRVEEGAVVRTPDLRVETSLRQGVGWFATHVVLLPLRGGERGRGEQVQIEVMPGLAEMQAIGQDERRILAHGDARLAGESQDPRRKRPPPLRHEAGDPALVRVPAQRQCDLRAGHGPSVRSPLATLPPRG